MKKIIYGVIIGGILFGSIGVLATNYLYKSEDVSYTSNKTDKTNVSGALNELYDEVHNIKPILTKTLVWSGTIDESGKSTTTISYINLNNYYANYRNITADNIGIEQTDLAASATSFGGCSTSWSYAPSTGLVTLTLTARKGFPNCGKQSYNVYVYTAETNK